MDSTKLRQSTEARKRRLPIELPIVTWSAAWLWLPACTSCSIVWPSSASRCSTQVKASASAGLWPCRPRTNSDTNGADIGGFERAMSAITRIRLLGSWSTVVIIWRAQSSRQVPVDAARRDTQRHAAQVLDQRQAQHDRDRPELAEVQGRDALVRGQEAAQALEVDAPVAMRDRLERDVVDAGEAGRRSVREARQFPAVVLRQVALRGADLLLDQVEVVEQPLAGRRHAAAGRDRLGQLLENPAENFLVGGQARQQLVGSAFRRERMRLRQVPAVLLHLVGAEELRPQGRLLERRVHRQSARTCTRLRRVAVEAKRPSCVDFIGEYS